MVVAFAGQLVLGWGIFNVVEGVLDHHILGLHHIRDLPLHVPAYDWVFLAAAGVRCIALGVILITTTHRVGSQKSASA